jgi:hypothetical protein
VSYLVRVGEFSRKDALDGATDVIQNVAAESDAASLRQAIADISQSMVGVEGVEEASQMILYRCAAKRRLAQSLGTPATTSSRSIESALTPSQQRPEHMGRPIPARNEPRPVSPGPLTRPSLPNPQCDHALIIACAAVESPTALALKARLKRAQSEKQAERAALKPTAQERRAALLALQKAQQQKDAEFGDELARQRDELYAARLKAATAYWEYAQQQALRGDAITATIVPRPGKCPTVVLRNNTDVILDYVGSIEGSYGSRSLTFLLQPRGTFEREYFSLEDPDCRRAWRIDDIPISVHASLWNRREPLAR